MEHLSSYLEQQYQRNKKQWYELFSDRPKLEIFEQMMSWENDEGKV